MLGQANGSWSRRLLLAALSAVGLIAAWAYATALASPGTGAFHDDGVYAVTAKALAEGEGYRLLSLPGEPPQTKYPVLFPLLLSLAWRLDGEFPANLMGLRMVPLLAGIAWLALVYRFLRREGEGPGSAGGLVLLTAAAPWIVFASTSLLSETVFAALLWAALLQLRGLERERAGDLGRVSLAALLCAAAVHTRLVGLVLLPAGVWALSRHGQRRAALLFGLVMAVAVAPWFGWIALQELPEAPYLEYYTASNYGSWNVLVAFDWVAKLRIVGWNLLYLAVAPVQLLVTSAWPWPILVGVGLLLAWSVLRDARAEAGVVHGFLLAYVGLLVLWAWRPLRFLVPVLPLLLWFLVRGLRRLLPAPGESGRGAVARHLLPILGIGLAAAIGWSLLDWARVTARTGVACPSGQCASAEWHELERAAAWLREHAPPGAVLAGDLDPLLYLYTGHKAVRAFRADPLRLLYEPGADHPLGSPGELRTYLESAGADYLVVTPLESFAETPHWLALVEELRETSPRLLVEIEAASGSWVTVYELRYGGAVAAP